MFLFSRFFRFDVSHTPVIGRKRLLHLRETAPYLCLIYIFLLLYSENHPQNSSERFRTSDNNYFHCGLLLSSISAKAQTCKNNNCGNNKHCYTIRKQRCNKHTHCKGNAHRSSLFPSQKNHRPIIQVETLLNTV